jgi:hypothetical protein
MAAATGQISIGDPVVMHPGVDIPHDQVVIDTCTTVRSGVMRGPVTTEVGAGADPAVDA